MRRHGRRWGCLAQVCAGLALLGAGCAKVEPAADFQRAGQLITERTGSQEVYDPQTDALIDQRLNALLTDGLTVEEAVQAALLNNRGLQSAFQEIGISRAEVVQAGLLTNPSFSMMFKLPEGGGRPDSEFSLGQQLADLWQVPVRKKIAKEQLEATILEVAQKAIDLAANVRVRCYELLALQRGEETLGESLKLVEQSQELAQRQFAAGSVSQLDVNLARSNVIEIHIELITLERERKTAEAALARLLNLSNGGKPWRLNDRLPEPEDSITGNFLELAMSRRLDARQAEMKTQQAEYQLRQEYLKVFPSLELGFDLEVLERRALPGRKILADTARESIANGALTAPSIQSRGERALERRQIIDTLLGPSLAFTIPVWDQNQAQIASARFRVIQRRKDFEDVLDRVANDIEQALTVAQSAQSLVRFYHQEALPQAQINVEGARRLYGVGQQSILALIEAQESFILRRRAYVRALGEYAVAMAELERAAGGRLPAAPTTRPASQPAIQNAS